MAGRATARWTVDVNRPPAEVFAYLADVSRNGEWSPKPYRVEGVEPGPISQGTTFTSFGYIPGDKEHRNEAEATELVAPNRLVLTATEPNGEKFINTWVLTATGSGCHVDREMDMPVPGGVMGVMFPLLLRAYVKPQIQKGLNMFKSNLESGKAAQAAG